jgi:hypothetical protein
MYGNIKSFIFIILSRIYMTIQELIRFCEIRINHLETEKLSHIQLGNLVKVAEIDNEIATTNSTLVSLKLMG